ncbi:MAG TPA: hypothetical protein VJK52_03885, partial [Candidatus Nanoarchaeia archaeon]|nr:hypothetical protein [Candidatus Nanoarchaeia archaeon]
MRSFGWLRQLFGMSRPAILGVFGFLGVFGVIEAESWTFLTLISLAALALLQMILRRQSKPVWTQKALTLVFTSILLLLV